MWQGATVSVVLMTYAERDSIREIINGFFETGVVDEVVVVNNNAELGTTEEVQRTRARQVFEPRQGYGWATRRGLAEGTGDLVVLAEPDGTFLPSDILKLLAYSIDCDAVFGTRTHRSLIWHGANMGWLLRVGNAAVAKLVTLLFRTERLSDVGCTYKLFHRHTLEKVLPELSVGGSQLGPELIIRTVLSGARFVEVPINYRERVGVSSVTGHLRKAIILGFQMIGLILRMRLELLLRPVYRPEPISAPRQLEKTDVVVDLREIGSGEPVDVPNVADR